jgi:hypothetical protein
VIGDVLFGEVRFICSINEIAMHRLLFLIVLYITISCKSSETSVSLSKPEEPADKIKNVMIVSMSPLKDTREMIEWELVYKLREKGYKTGPSHAFVDGVLDKDNIVAAMKKNGFDGVITIALKDTRAESQYQRSDRYLSDPNYIYFSNYFDATYGAKYNATIYVVETNGYLLENEQLAFSATSESFNIGNLEEIVGEFSNSMAKSIDKAKVLEKIDP